MLNFERKTFILYKYLVFLWFSFSNEVFSISRISRGSLTNQQQKEDFYLRKNACCIAYYIHLGHGCVFQGIFFGKKKNIFFCLQPPNKCHFQPFLMKEFFFPETQGTVKRGNILFLFCSMRFQ